MHRQNCWEIKECGREKGGTETGELGICPAVTDASSNGKNNGKNGGRICWAVAGTFCDGRVQGTYAHKQVSCMACEVFKQVKKEEGLAFTFLKSGQTYQAAVK